MTVKKVHTLLDGTQDEFARRVGASEAAVQLWESGKNRPSKPALLKMKKLAPSMAPEIDRLLNYKWHPKRIVQSSRYGPEIRQAHHAALDMVLDLADSSTVEIIVEQLHKTADRLIKLRDAFPEVIAPPANAPTKGHKLPQKHRKLV